MPADTERFSVLLATGSERTAAFFAGVLDIAHFSGPRIVSTAGEVKRIMVDKPADIVIVDTPLPDDFGLQLALDLTENGTAGALLLVRREQFEETAERAGGYGVLTLCKPPDYQAARQAMLLLAATQRRLLGLKARTDTLETRMDDIRLVNRAKLILVDRLRMTESEAHRYIEKTAMDQCVKRRDVAESVIRNEKNIRRAGME